MTNYWIFTPYTAPERNTVWQADHFELPIDVIADGHETTLVKPWLTLFVDDTTRKVMAWALTAEPTAGPMPRRCGHAGDRNPRSVSKTVSRLAACPRSCAGTTTSPSPPA